MEIEIRVFQERDTEEVVALWTEALGYDRPHSLPRKTIALKAAYQSELFFVAIQDSRVIGTVMGGYDGHRGWVYSLAVLPECRRQGVATSLMAHVEGALNSMGCVKVNLQVMPSNEGLIPFYQALGYEVEPRISLGKLI